MRKKITVNKGDTFSNWTVLEEAESRGGRRYILCRCKCGIKKEVRLEALRTGKSESCGCMRHLTGKKFGQLRVIKPLDKRSGRTIIYLCQCDCGNTAEVASVYLTNGDTRSCGCLKIKQDKINLRDKYEAQRVNGVVTSLLKSKLRVDNTTGVKGVSYRKDKKLYTSAITVNGKKIHLKQSKNLEEASKTRKKAEEEFYEPYLD